METVTRNVLIIACLYGHDGCVKALIFQSPARKLNPYNEKGDTPLHIGWLLILDLAFVDVS